MPASALRSFFPPFYRVFCRYYCLSRLLDGVQDNFTFAQKGIQRKVFALKRLTRRVEPELYVFLPSAI